MKYFLLLILLGLTMTNCKSNEIDGVLNFGVDPLDPPFSFVDQNGKLTGIEIEIDKLLAKKLCKEAKFQQMDYMFNVQSLIDKKIDIVIGTITKERDKNFDFSEPFNYESFSIVFDKKNSFSDIAMLGNKKIGVHLGSSMAEWLKNHVKNNQILLLNNNAEIIENLKVGAVDFALLYTNQATHFIEKNNNLDQFVVENSDKNIGYMVKKDNKDLLNEINKFIIEEQDAIKKVMIKYLGDESEESIS